MIFAYLVIKEPARTLVIQFTAVPREGRRIFGVVVEWPVAVMFNLTTRLRCVMG